MSPAATIATTCLIALGTCSCTPADPPPLNVVLIVIDDLGWMDSGTYGSTFYETPNIDRLASEGVRFTDFYTASSVCSPTRASLMTGKHPARLDLTNWIGGEQSGLLDQAEYIRELPLSEVTVGEAFQAAGYQTGYVGKWHLGGAEFLPDAQGFDYMFAVNEAGQPGAYFPPYENPNYAVTNVPDLDGDPEGTYLTDRLTDVTIDFLTEHQEEPFFFVLSHYAVHTPLQAKPEVTARYADRPKTWDPSRADTRRNGKRRRTPPRPPHLCRHDREHDQSVGRILDALDDLELWERTIVMFVSDNGGLSTLMRRSPTQATSNLPLRAGKGWLYEGGIRAPLIVRTPGVPAGGLVSDHPASSTDLYPTLLALAGLPARPEQHVDGVSLAAALTAGEAARDTLYWHFPHYHGSGNRPGGAIRAGNLKLVEWFEDGSVELYDLATDLSEDHDLATERPEDTQRLQDRLHAWRAKVGANMPTARN